MQTKQNSTTAAVARLHKPFIVTAAVAVIASVVALLLRLLLRWLRVLLFLLLLLLMRLPLYHALQLHSINSFPFLFSASRIHQLNFRRLHLLFRNHLRVQFLQFRQPPNHLNSPLFFAQILVNRIAD